MGDKDYNSCLHKLRTWHPSALLYVVAPGCPQHSASHSVLDRDSKYQWCAVEGVGPRR